MHRRDFLTTTGATAAAITAPSFIGPFDGLIGSSDTLTAAALSSDADIKTFGDNTPSFLLAYPDASARESLGAWLEGNDAEIKRDLSSLNMVSVSMPWSEVGLQQYSTGVADFDIGIDRLSGGLQAKDYLDSIDANMILSRPEPLEELEGTDAWSFDLGWRQSLSLMAQSLSTSPAPEPGGLAFDEDAVEATLSESRAHVRADDSVLSGVDTSGLTVAVIDTGVNTGTNLDESRLHAESTGFAKDGDPTMADDGTDAVADGDGHGTWVAHSTVGATSRLPSRQPPASRRT